MVLSLVHRVQLSFLAKDLGDIAPDHVDASLIGSHAIHAYLDGEDQDEAIVLEILIQLVGQLVHVAMIGEPVLAAHHEDKIVVAPEITCQNKKIIPIGKLHELARYGVFFLHLTDVREGFV